MAAAMFGKMVGEGINNQKIPPSVKKFGSSSEEIFNDMQELCMLYGKDAKNIPMGGRRPIFIPGPCKLRSKNFSWL